MSKDIFAVLCLELFREFRFVLYLANRYKYVDDLDTFLVEFLAFV